MEFRKTNPEMCDPNMLMAKFEGNLQAQSRGSELMVWNLILNTVAGWYDFCKNSSTNQHFRFDWIKQVGG